MLKAVIFDMDGVLIDSEPLHYEANSIFLKENFNIDLKYKYYKQFIGSTVPYMWGKMKEDFSLEGFSVEELRIAADEIKQELIDTKGYMKIEGASSFVKSLKGLYKMAVASSSFMEKIKNNVNEMDLAECFDELVSGTQMTKPKPDPEIFIETAKRLGVKPSECIVIEDSQNGVKAAKAAGMAALGFINPNSGDQNLSMADYLFEAFDGIDAEFLKMVHAHCFDEPYIPTDTERLNIREILVDDKDSIMCARLIRTALKLEDISDAELEEYIKDYRKNSYKFLGFGLWLLELKSTGEVIGIAGIDRKVNGDFELGYYICEEYRGCGYAYEACAEIMDYIRDFGLDKVNVTIERTNIPSINLAKKLMFDEFYSNDEFVFMDKDMS